MSVICTLRHRPVRYYVHRSNQTSPVVTSRYRWVALAHAAWAWLFTTSTVTVTDRAGGAS